MEQGRGLKKQARKVLKNQKARKELFNVLKKCGKEDGEVPNICIYLVNHKC